MQPYRLRGRRISPLVLKTLQRYFHEVLKKPLDYKLDEGAVNALNLSPEKCLVEEERGRKGLSLRRQCTPRTLAGESSQEEKESHNNFMKNYEETLQLPGARMFRS